MCQVIPKISFNGYNKNPTNWKIEMIWNWRFFEVIFSNVHVRSTYVPIFTEE